MMMMMLLMIDDDSNINIDRIVSWS